MIFLDSWVWLQFLFDGEKAHEAESVIERADTPETGGLITPTVIAEVSNRVRRVEGDDTAEDVVGAIHDYEHIESVPVVDEVGEYAAKLRDEYYEPSVRELSYPDAIHLATADLHDDCDCLYSGGPDFEDIGIIETVVL